MLERLVVDPVVEAQQRERLARLRAGRENERVSALLARIESAAQGDENLMPLFVEAVRGDVTLGEICEVLRGTWGEYRPVTRV
jgi:methylmalonyl-CoA mutase N-terminal domain/subunit